MLHRRYNAFGVLVAIAANAPFASLAKWFNPGFNIWKTHLKFPRSMLANVLRLNEKSGIKLPELLYLCVCLLNAIKWSRLFNDGTFLAMTPVSFFFKYH